jgi:hypothetical protein
MSFCFDCLYPRYAANEQFESKHVKKLSNAYNLLNVGIPKDDQKILESSRVYKALLDVIRSEIHIIHQEIDAYLFHSQNWNRQNLNKVKCDRCHNL